MPKETGKKEIYYQSLNITIFAPENGWLEDDFPLKGDPIFRGKLAVSFREGNIGNVQQ